MDLHICLAGLVKICKFGTIKNIKIYEKIYTDYCCPEYLE